MENFKPKSLSEMNAEFAQKLLQQTEDKTKDSEEVQQTNTPQIEEPEEKPIDETVSIQDDASQNFEEIDLSVVENESQEKFVAEVEEPENNFNLFEEVKLPVINEKLEDSEKETGEKTEEVLPEKLEHTEPNPTGFFGPPIDKQKKKEKEDEHKPQIEPKFDFEKTLDYSGTQLKKSFRPKKKKSKGIRKLLNTAIGVVIVISLVVGLAAFAAAKPGRFLFGQGILICEETIENTNLTEGMLLFVQAAASASEDEFVAVYRNDMTDYEIISAKDVSFRDTVFAVAKRGIDVIGKYLSVVIERWVLFAGAAIAVLITLIVLKVVLFKDDKDMMIGENPKHRRKKQILDF